LKRNIKKKKYSVDLNRVAQAYWPDKSKGREVGLSSYNVIFKKIKELNCNKLSVEGCN
jgi:hypothetical protein